MADPSSHRSPRHATQSAAQPQANVNDLPHIFVYHEDGLSMDRPEVQNIQDAILLEHLATTEATNSY